jgi:hypothetical protein
MSQSRRRMGDVVLAYVLTRDDIVSEPQEVHP